MSVHESTKFPLMPKATAIWLVENTSLTFLQIGEFCGLHELEVSAVADGESLQGMMGINPIAMGQLTLEEIERCQKDPVARLQLQEVVADELVKKKIKKHESKGGGKYTPRARRGERPDAIAWLIKQYPTLTDTQIVRLIGTTKATIESIRTRTHWNIEGIKPRSPIILGFCSQEELEDIVTSSQKKKEEKKTEPKIKKNPVHKVKVSKKKEKAPKKVMEKPKKKEKASKKAIEESKRKK